MLVNLKAMPSASCAIAPKIIDSDLERISSDNPEAKFETDIVSLAIALLQSQNNF